MTAGSTPPNTPASTAHEKRLQPLGSARQGLLLPHWPPAGPAGSSCPPRPTPSRLLPTQGRVLTFPPPPRREMRLGPAPSECWGGLSGACSHPGLCLLLSSSLVRVQLFIFSRRKKKKKRKVVSIWYLHRLLEGVDGFNYKC